MTKRELNNKYFEWMYTLVTSEQRTGRLSYKKLLRCLHSVEFTYSIAMDANRAEDGEDLRYRFGYENDLERSVIEACLDDGPCSVLEMMVALSIRCEEHIMGDPDIGDRTGQWFWDMVDNLGLTDMTDSRFDENHILMTIERFLDHGYGRNGKGGLFRIHNSPNDLRSVEIWCQMMWYLNERS